MEILNINHQKYKNVHKFFNSIKTRGFARTIKLIYRVLKHYKHTSFDRRHCIDTHGNIELDTLKITSKNKKHGVQYQPVPVGILRKSINRLRIPYKYFNFIDFGSGKGRALLVSSEFPFKKIIGVEFAPELHKIAERNISKFQSKHQKCFDIESVYIDAENFIIPAVPTVFFFFNPFDLDVMHSVIKNIRFSLDICPRELYIIYYNPLHYNLFIKAGIERKNIIAINI